MVLVFILPHAKIGPNDHQEDELHCILIRNLSWVTLARYMTKDIEIDEEHEPVLNLILRGQRAVHPDIHEYSRLDPDTRPLVPWTMKAPVEYHKRPIQYCHYDLFAQNTIRHCYNPQKPRRTKSHRWNKTFWCRNSILLFVAKLIISWFELNEVANLTFSISKMLWKNFAKF